MSVSRSRDTRAEATQRLLIRHARRLFARRGYADTSLQEIVDRAGVTKGALYHHFSDKHDLFRAVVEKVARELTVRVEAAASPQDDPWHRLEVMSRAYLDASLDAGLTRIRVLDAPVVLGWKAWCEIGERQETAAFARCLREAATAGAIHDEEADTMAQVLLGALNTAARLIATATHQAAARAQAEGTVNRLLAGLRDGIA